MMNERHVPPTPTPVSFLHSSLWSFFFFFVFLCIKVFMTLLIYLLAEPFLFFSPHFYLPCLKRLADESSVYIILFT